MFVGKLQVQNCKPKENFNIGFKPEMKEMNKPVCISADFSYHQSNKYELITYSICFNF